MHFKDLGINDEIQCLCLNKLLTMWMMAWIRIRKLRLHDSVTLTCFGYSAGRK